MTTKHTPGPWVHILSAEEIGERFNLTATLDPNFARQEREFYESRSIGQLSALAAASWCSNDPSGYQMARSYRARMGAQ